MIKGLLKIADKTFHSRLIMGSALFSSAEQMIQAHGISRTEIITASIQRISLDAKPLLESIDLEKYWVLPNTAGCLSADEAVRLARLARAMGLNNWIKVEVILDQKSQLPNPTETYRACKLLLEEGFVVLPYTNCDPLFAYELHKLGCHAIMPYASPIGTGRGISEPDNLKKIIAFPDVPVIIDAGIGVPSEAAALMEMGADAVMVNSAVAESDDPICMAEAFGMAVEAGRMAFLAGRMPIREVAQPSSPQYYLS